MNVIPQWAYAYGEPQIKGCFRVKEEDFFVEEHLPFDLTHEGEHWFLFVEKVGQNTDWVAQQLARALGVSPRLVSYAGLKDRHAVTRQWFSIHLPGINDISLQAFETIEGIQLLKVDKHNKKLRRGSIQHNAFALRLRDCALSGSDLIEEDGKGDKTNRSENGSVLNESVLNEGVLEAHSLVTVQQCINQRLQKIKEQGVPNYFGEQRFGHQGNNISQALLLFEGKRGSSQRLSKQKKGLYLSAARSFIFNHMLSDRVEEGHWCRYIPGDLMMFERGGSFFQVMTEEEAHTIQARIDSGELSPSGLLWGEPAKLRCSDEAAKIEQKVADEFVPLCEGLVEQGVKSERRQFILRPKELEWTWESQHDVLLKMVLPSGSYATSVLRELGQWENSFQRSP